MITRTKVCAGSYRYQTEAGSFGLNKTSQGWVVAQWSPENGTVEYGTFPTLRDADVAMTEMAA